MKTNSTKQPEKTKAIQPGVIYISRLPYGFDDKAAFEFFPQFGEIKGVCFPRSKKTARSKGYMFVMFADQEVAKVAVKTMDGYVMVGKQLQAHLIQTKPGTAMAKKFKTEFSKFKFVPWKLLFRQRFNQAKGEDAVEKKIRRLLDGDQKKLQKLRDLDIDFNFPSYRNLLKN